MNVTRALRRPLAANAGGTWTRDGEPVRVARCFPSMLNATRLISRPRTVAVKPALQAASGCGRGFGRVSVACPFRVGTAEWLAAGGVPPGPVGVGFVAGGFEVEAGGAVVDVPHMEPSITSLSSVTAPVLASTRPWTVAPLLTVIEVCAIRLPSNAVVLPSVAELPICQ